MSAPYYSPYAPSIQSPYSSYPQPGGGFPGIGLPSQPGGLGQLPQPSGDTFAPGAPGAEAAAPPPEAGAPGEGGSQLPTTVFSYKGGYADKNSTLPDGNNAWRNYWMGVGGVGAGYATLAGIAAARSGRLGSLVGNKWYLPFGKAFNPTKWGIIKSGSDGARKSILEGHFPLKEQVLSLVGKSKDDAKKLTAEISKNVETHVNNTKGSLVTGSEDAEKLDKMAAAWNDYKTHLDAQDATDTTIAEKHTSLAGVFNDIEKNIFTSEGNKGVFQKPIEAHLGDSHKEALQAVKALKESEGSTLDEATKRKLHQTATEKLGIWKNSIETLKAPSDSLKTLAIKPDMNEAEQTALENALESLDPLTGAPKAANTTTS